MRVYRHSLFPDSKEQEIAVELNEGLAESTGIEAALNTRKARIKATINEIKKIDSLSNYVRTFAYATGPAYAVFLNIADPGWRRHVTPAFKFATAISKVDSIPMPSPNKTEAMAAIDRHGGKKIIAQENKRAKKIAAQNKRYNKEFIKGSIISFPIIHSKRSFNVRHITHFKGHGNVYGILTDHDVWGVLKVQDGDALLLPNKSKIVLPIDHKMSGRNLSGDGWKATLNKDYKLAPDSSRSGSYVVVKADEHKKDDK